MTDRTPGTPADTASEFNFDGLVGPTHHYGGLAHGNLASQRHRHRPSSPKNAALEGLAKIRRLAQMGIPQAVLPPHDRPDMTMLRQLGFEGTDVQVLERAGREAADLLSACASASAMWAANTATVSPSPDTEDGRLHLTPANLISQFHRSLEAPTTTAVLSRVFADAQRFAVHEPLPAALRFSDEGAANHSRLCPRHDDPGVELFVYGRDNAPDHPVPLPHRFPARQSLEASRAIARRHSLAPQRTVFARQNPEAIDAGVFHNDVIAVANRNVLLYHEQAYVDTAAVIDELRQAYAAMCDDELVCVEVAAGEVSVAEVVDTYLFNSQLLALADGCMLLVCPSESRANPRTSDTLDRIVQDPANPIASVLTVDVRQSMQNGGGPACLRLRIVLGGAERAAAHPGVFWSEALDRRLVQWVQKHYRDELTPADLVDPTLLAESRTALDELTQILGLGSVYAFQQ